ncbi:MAG: diguanylate cyclase [Planctomycetota bacterium]
MPSDDELQGLISRLDRALAVQSPQNPGAAPASGVVPNDLLDRWQRLCETSALLNGHRNDYESVLETVLDTAISLTRARRGFVFLKNEDGGLDVHLARDAKKRALEAPHDYPRSVVDTVTEQARPLFLPDVADGQAELGASVRNLGLISVLCAPLSSTATATDGAEEGQQTERRRFTEVAKDELLGCIYLDSNATTYRFAQEDLYLFLILANHATTALLKERLYRQAITDPLTRLFTRSHFERMLGRGERRFETTRAPFALLMLDVDQFHLVNDRHGQLVGDAVLRELAELCRATVRQDDLCFRYGNDEFAILLPDTDAQGAQTAAEKLLKAIGAHVFGRDVAVSVSVGYAAAPEHATSGGELVRKADQALFKAKHEGRGRVAGWTPELGNAAPRADRLAGVITGNAAKDYAQVLLLVDTVDALSKTHDVQEVLTLAVDVAVRAADAERGAIMLADDQGALSTVVARGRRHENLELKERFSRTIPEKVLRTGEPAFVVTSSEGHTSESVRELGLRTVLCAPLVTDAGRIGCLYVDARRGEQEIREANRPYFAALARHIALAVENARLRARLALEGK